MVNTSTRKQNLSPRQVANKAYQLGMKKLDKDDKRKRPQYSVRERLLLSNTIVKAEEMLNKSKCRIPTCTSDDDDILPSTIPITYYNTLPFDFCKPIMIPSHHYYSLNAAIINY